MCVLFYSFHFFLSFGQAQKVAIDEELAKTLQRLRELTLSVEASERCVRLVLPAVLTNQRVCLSCQVLGYAYDTTRKRSPYERCV